MAWLGVRRPTYHYPDPGLLGHGPHGGRHDPYRIAARLRERRQPKKTKIRLAAGFPPGYADAQDSSSRSRSDPSSSRSAWASQTSYGTSQPSDGGSFFGSKSDSVTGMEDVDPRMLEHIRSNDGPGDPPQWWLDEFRKQYANPFLHKATDPFPPETTGPSAEAAKTLAKVRKGVKLSAKDRRERLKRAKDPVYDRECMNKELEDKCNSTGRKLQEQEDIDREVDRETARITHNQQPLRGDELATRYTSREKYRRDAEEKLLERRRARGDLSGYLYCTPQEMEKAKDMQNEGPAAEGYGLRPRHPKVVLRGGGLVAAEEYDARAKANAETTRIAQAVWKREQEKDEPWIRELRSLPEMYPDGPPGGAARPSKRKVSQMEQPQQPRKLLRWGDMGDVSQTAVHASFDSGDLAATQLQHELRNAVNDGRAEGSAHNDDFRELEGGDGHANWPGRSIAGEDSHDWRKTIIEKARQFKNWVLFPR